MTDVINLTVREQTQAAFVLREVNEIEAFALKDSPVDDVTLIKAPSLTGNISLQGPQGLQGPQLKGISVFCSGRPTSQEVIGGGLSPYDFTITEANCLAKAKVPSTNNVTFDIRNDNISIGSVIFIAGQVEGSVTIATSNINAGDYVTFHAPLNADLTLADIGIIIKE